MFWVIIIYGSTMFLPWREIYKGISVFVILPLWWEYGNPANNYILIISHIALSIIFGLSIAITLKGCINRCLNKV